MPKFKFIDCPSVTILANREPPAMPDCAISTLTFPFYFPHPNTSHIQFMHMHTQHINRPHILQTWIYTLTYTSHIEHIHMYTIHTYTLTSHTHIQLVDTQNILTHNTYMCIYTYIYIYLTYTLSIDTWNEVTYCFRQLFSLL